MKIKVYNYRYKYEGPAAAFYDQDHSWRDYEGQSRFVASLLPRPFLTAGKPVAAKILDLCCGSGSHSVALSKLGLAVTGVDRSSDLLAQAKVKAAKRKLPVAFIQRDMYALGNKNGFKNSFDACLMFGWTLSLQPVYRRFKDILNLAHDVLKPGGIFIFDVPLNRNAKRDNPPVLNYSASREVSGVLSVEEKKNPSGAGASVFFYNWSVTDGKGREDFVVKEVLSHVRYGDVSAAVSNSKFASASYFGDYDARRKYSPGGSNLISVLKK